MSTEEIVEMSTEMSTEIATSGDVVVEVSANTQILEGIANDVHLIMVFALLTFVLSCLRGWRRNVVKGAR